MKVTQYAESKSLDLKLIPSIDDTNLVLFSNKLKTSRTIKNISLKTPLEEYEGTLNQALEPNLDYWSDYKYDYIKYINEYNEYAFIETINNCKNIFDKVLNLNPKQIGVVNSNISKLFCDGNEIHYSILNSGFIPLIHGVRTNKNKYNDAEFYRNINFDSGSLGWGEFKINNILFSSIIDSFYTEDKVYTRAIDTTYEYNLKRRISENDLSDLLYINFKTDTNNQYGPFYIYASGSKIAHSFSFIDDEIYKNYSIRLTKNNDFSNEGSLKGVINKSSGLKAIEEKMRKMYFWKSALITTFSENNTINYYILVGIKPFRYLLTKEIDKIFFIDLGNTLNNSKFDNTDIIFYYSDLKTFLKKSNANVVYFTDLSMHSLGNICPTGLAFGIDTELSKNVVKIINSGSTDYSSVEYEINNIYNIFTNLEG